MERDDARSIVEKSLGLRVVVMRLGMPAGSATASTATGSGGASAAARTIAPEIPIPGRRNRVVPASAAIEVKTKSTEKERIVDFCERMTAHEVWRANAQRSGGRNTGSMSSAGISRSGVKGINAPPAATMVSSAGQGRPGAVTDGHHQDRGQKQTDEHE
jgi:hypothetical protein